MRYLRKRNRADWRLLVRYLAGECSEREEAEVQALVAADEDIGRLLDDLRRVWDVSDASCTEMLSDDAGWQLLSRRLRQDGGPATPPLRKVGDISRAEASRDFSPSRSPRRRRSRFRTRRSWSVAAVLVLMALAGLLAVFSVEPSQPMGLAAGQVIETEKGQRSLIRLPDGTQVILNADSRLILPAEGFAARQRVVRLEGEAYFEVTADSTRPFLVHAKHASLRVLGTAFVVQAYTEEEGVQVAVAEGKVALRPERQDTTVVLERHHLGVVSDAGLRTVRRKVDLAPYLAWTKGALVFDDAPFGEVARRLERWYDVRIEVEVPMDGIDRLNATFEDESLNQVLKAVAAALDLQYEKDQRAVTFYRSGSTFAPPAQLTR